MQALTIFLWRVLGVVFSLGLILTGIGMFGMSPPKPEAGWILIGIGLLCLCYVLWPRPSRATKPHTTTKPFSYDQERQAADERKVVHITYRDKSGRASSRDIEVYRPRDDSYVYAFCRSRKEPRTFLVEGILDWQITDETFLWNPLVEEWFEREGRKGSNEREDWQDWITTKQRRTKRQ